MTKPLGVASRIEAGWLERFDLVNDILSGEILYVEGISRKRPDIADTDRVIEVRIHNKPYPSVEDKDEATFKHEVFDWMRSSVEICIIETSWIGDSKHLTNFWEPCAFCTFLMVAGYEVMVGEKTRHAAGSVLLTRDQQSATRKEYPSLRDHESMQSPDSQVYYDFPKMLKLAMLEKKSGSTEPPRRKRTTRQDAEHFRNLMDLDI